MINSKALKSKIIDKFDSQSAMCDAIGINRSQFSNYLNNVRPMPYEIIDKLIPELNLTNEEVVNIFFAR